MKRTAFGLSLFAGILSVGVLVVSPVLADHLEKLEKPRFFELRTYTTHEGKLPELHQRFSNHTNKLFVKHGMQLVGYWTPADEGKSKNTLVYMLAYPDRKSRDVAWGAFRNDPGWKKAFADSRKNGPLVAKVESQFLTPTDYSPIR